MRAHLQIDVEEPGDGARCGLKTSLEGAAATRISRMEDVAAARCVRANFLDDAASFVFAHVIHKEDLVFVAGGIQDLA